MKTILFLLLTFPAWVFAQNTADSLTVNPQIFVEIPLDTGTIKADTLMKIEKKKETPLKAEVMPEILYFNNRFRFSNGNYVSINKLKKLVKETNDDEAINYLKKYRRNQSIFIGILTTGSIVASLGVPYAYVKVVDEKTDPNSDPFIFIRLGLGIMASSVIPILNNRQNLKKSVNRYNELRKISYNLKPSSSSLGLSFSVRF
jgi:hypothetical protein